MKGKVNCTCGWSWNKSDSSAKDMYICHECGRDNSNNMKNGGWLDQYADGGTMQEHQENYNNSQSSAPEGMVGDGFSNVGRNYSPAWGGQFKEGGEIPNAQKGKKVKYVESKNDPRYKAYRDSLSSYERGRKAVDLLNKNTIGKNWLDSYDVETNKKNLDKIYTEKEKKKLYNKKNYKNLEYFKKDDTNKDYWKPLQPGFDAINENVKISNVLPYAAFDIVGEENLNKVPVWKKPEEEVIVQRPQEIPITNFIQPASSSFNIEASLPVIRLDARVPKYYDVEDYTQGSANYINNQTNYRTSDLSTLSEQSPNNKRKITPRYQIGGNVYPVNYVPQAQEGIKMPSRKDYKTQGQYNAALRQYKLNLRKYELNNNPEKLKGESDKDYENRTKYFKHKVRQEENKNPVSKAYLEMKDDQNADPNPVTKALRQIFTSPIHVAHGIYNAANPHDLDRYKSRATKNNEDIDLGSSSLDAVSLGIPFDYGMKAIPLWLQALKRTGKEVIEDKGFDLIKQANEYINSFQTGGSLPGVPGHMYDRVGAPSKGPRRNQVDVTDASAQNGQEMQYYQEGLDWQPKTISREGSIIKDDMGYWNPENWDSPVEIGSNEITMQNVPFDVLGISDEGDVQHMKANSPKNYKYKGKKVTEFRMAKNGIRQEQKGLVNLDQLTNFTNYNKPQPGGWLNKYN